MLLVPVGVINGIQWAVVGQKNGRATTESDNSPTFQLTWSIPQRWLRALKTLWTLSSPREDHVVNGEVSFVVCVSTDVTVRERVVRRLDDCGAVVLCADLAELRAMLFPAMAVASAIPSIPSIPAADTPVRLGELVVDTTAHLVTWRDQPLALTRLERELLARLASPPIGVWTYERLFGTVWGGAYLGDTSILHSAVKRLRRKLREAEDGPTIETVRGVGYRLAPRSAEPGTMAE